MCQLPSATNKHLLFLHKPPTIHVQTLLINIGKITEGKALALNKG